MKTEKNDRKNGKGRIPKNQNDGKRERTRPCPASYFPDLESLAKQQEENMNRILNSEEEVFKKMMLKVGGAIIKEDVKLLKELAKH